MLLLRPNEFKNRVYDFVKENSPEHWKQNNWHEKHMAFQNVTFKIISTFFELIIQFFLIFRNFLKSFILKTYKKVVDSRLTFHIMGIVLFYNL